ncbi:hypothetical protein TcasGA2_TC006320 [Tribolium castaneum]|uniref:Uncharacterized protein n=1 Tax=Tribolium castaneum TaxID=7070 RepID=D6WW31_TRICA|nr:hypothetical protein TcasGA2_TC006320 [Tribolium castaneum]
MEEYSSDDEIACGPLTLKEVKKELQNEPRKIERSCSDLGRYSLQKTGKRIESKELEDVTNFDLNDTVKEMEMALQYGLDYHMEDENQFKKPAKAAKGKKTPKNKYDYIVSPVARYIKTRDFWANKENVGSANAKKLTYKNC